MKYIISGTNRPNSRSMELAYLIQKDYKSLGEDVEIISLCDFPLNQLSGAEYSDNKPEKLIEMNSKIDSSDGLIVITPEYNGSMPGVLKLFIDHMSFPKAFERRPVCFVGLGGMFGGLRPVEHLQQVFGYRNAYIYPFRVFFVNVWDLVKAGSITDESSKKKLLEQAQGFQKFCRALSSEKIHANL